MEEQNSPRLKISKKQADWFKSKAYIDRLIEDGELFIEQNKGKIKFLNETYSITQKKENEKKGTRYYAENIKLNSFYYNFYMSVPESIEDDKKACYILFDDNGNRCYVRRLKTI